MDPLQRDLVTLAWEHDLRVSSLKGGTEGVLGRPASELVGRPLHEVVGVSAEDAYELHLRATPEGVVEHLTFWRDGHPVCLRATFFLVEVNRRAASVLNLTALLDGAPHLQSPWLDLSSRDLIWDPLSGVKVALRMLGRSPGLSNQDQRKLAFANRQARDAERALSLLFDYADDCDFQFDEGMFTRPSSVRSLLQEAANVVQAELAKRNVELAFQEEDGDLPPVMTNAFRLSPVISQLLLDVANRLDQGCRLVITLRRSGNGVQAVIADPSWVELPDERTLYEPFRSRRMTRVSFALPALRRLMRRYGGQFVAEADGSYGTRYVLTFAG
jgi:two-component system, NtrC family, sensor histidine kinase HydH